MTIERPMFPPVDPTRRRLLILAAGGGIAALAPAVAAALPQGSASAVSPALIAAIAELGRAHEILLGAKAASDAANDLCEVWERDNPQPESKRGKRRWIKKARAYHLSVTPKPWQVLMKAELVFAQAQIDVALAPVAGIADVRAMAACSIAYDRVELARVNRAPIALMVAQELSRFNMAVQS